MRLVGLLAWAMVDFDSGDGTVYTLTGRIPVVTGASPHTLTVSSPVGPGTLTFRGRDASGITAVGGFGEASLPQGSVKCAETPVPLGVGGVAIRGTQPTRTRVTLSGDNLVVSLESFEDGLCLEGATVRLDWGTAAVERVWMVLRLSS